MTATVNAVDAAAEYADLGFRVFPLKPGAKVPATKNGCKDATGDVEQIERWWGHTPDANVAIATAGLLVVDIDGADNSLLRNADRMLELSVAPYTQTPSGGRHYLFQQPPGTWGNTTSKLAPKVDTRADGGYIVAPPSVLTNGGYKWLSDPLDVSPERLPLPPQWVIDGLVGDAELAEIAAINGSDARDLVDISQGVVEGGRNDAAARYIGERLRGLPELSDAAVRFVRDAATGWNTRNRPPLDEGELGKVFESIYRREIQRRTGEAAVLPLKPEQIARGDERGDLRLEIVDSDPRTFRLHSSRWEGYVVLSEDDLMSPTRLAKRVLGQADYMLPSLFLKQWKSATLPQLYNAASHVAAPREMKRSLVVAEHLYNALSQCFDRDEPMKDGRPVRVADVGITFKFNTVWEDMHLSADKITRAELIKAVEAAGIDQEYRPRVGGKRMSFKVCTTENLAKLEEMLDG
ncbi:bifunctional DNA primase/polymerase [Aeoliella sp.]|uniref:bifunctional DNA primase/polymerase n=1 Tax=Aeoliella sp. TaxID=2795800 RepID=UPI003CCBE6DC